MGLDPVIQYRRYVEVTDDFSLNTFQRKNPQHLLASALKSSASKDLNNGRPQ